MHLPRIFRDSVSHKASRPYKTDQGAGGVFLFTDGSVTTIRDDVDITLLRNLIGIADGQVLGEFPRLRPDRRTSYQQILVLEIPRNKPGAAAELDGPGPARRREP